MLHENAAKVMKYALVWTQPVYESYAEILTPYYDTNKIYFNTKYPYGISFSYLLLFYFEMLQNVIL